MQGAAKLSEQTHHSSRYHCYLSISLLLTFPNPTQAGEEARQRDSAHDPYPAPPGVARQLPNPKGTGTMVPTNLRYSCRAQLDLKRRAMLVRGACHISISTEFDFIQDCYDCYYYYYYYFMLLFFFPGRLHRSAIGRGAGCGIPEEGSEEEQRFDLRI